MTTNRDERHEQRVNSLLGSITRESNGNELMGYYSEPDVTERPYEPEVRGQELANTVREVNIKPLNSGYLVKVGCQSVAVETTETLLKALGQYLNNPDSFETAWYKNKNRNKL